MKKIGLILLSAFWLLLPSRLHAIHTLLRNASNLTAGTLPNARLDPSSVTLQGNTFNGANQLVQLDGSGKVPATSLSISTSSPGKTYDVIIGSLASSSIQVDIASNNVNGIKQAVLTLAGAINATSGAGSIFLKQGVYTWGGATIPAGVSLYCTEGSSTIITNIASGDPIVTIYGKVEGCTFDLNFSSNLNSSPLISMRANSKMRNCKVINGDRAQPGSNTFDIVNTTGVEISNVDLIGVVNGNTIGTSGSSPFGITKSSDILLRNVSFSRQNGRDIGLITLEATNRVTLDGLRFNDFKACAVYMPNGGNQDLSIINSVFNITDNLHGSAGALDLTGVVSSTLAYIANNQIIVVNSAATTGTFIKIANAFLSGIMISNNTMKSSFANTMTFTNVGANVVGTVLKGNATYGIATFLTDSGTGTKSASNDNFKDGIEQ